MCMSNKSILLLVKDKCSALKPFFLPCCLLLFLIIMEVIVSDSNTLHTVQKFRFSKIFLVLLKKSLLYSLSLHLFEMLIK